MTAIKILSLLMDITVTESKKFIAILSQTLSSAYLIMTKFTISWINYFSHKLITYLFFFNSNNFQLFSINGVIFCYYTFWRWYVSNVHWVFAHITKDMLTRNDVLFSLYSVFTMRAYVLVIKFEKLKYVWVFLSDYIQY